ncbi:MAG: hypothetical protein Q9212_006252 [Teloschistes hypoglaucus]
MAMRDTVPHLLLVKLSMANDEDEQSFKRMWEDAQRRFEQKTNKSLVQHSPSLDDVLKDLDERFNDGDLDNDKKRQRVQKVKRLASNVLKLIQLLGGIAAQGASVVFGPAAQCFCAFKFLLDIPARISRFHDDLANLFAEISTFLKVFKIYQRIEDFARVDVELKRCAHKLMILIVDICALSINCFSGSTFRKLWSDAKVALFEDDTGVKAKLEEFKTLINHQSQISDAVTLEHVLRSEQEQTGSLKKVFDMLNQTSDATNWKLQEINEELKDVHRDTKIVAKYVAASTDQKERQDQIEQIYKKLSVETNDLNYLEKAFDQIRGDTQDATGSWLDDIEVYKKWADLNAECDHPVLWLSGESGTGKTHLAFTILNSFMKRASSAENNSIRVSSAFYRYDRNEKRPRDDTVKYSLNCIAAQLAKKNTVYMKRLSSHLDSKENPTTRQKSVEDLFKELIAPPKKNDTSDITYVLLFDGMDQLSDDEPRQLANAVCKSSPSRVRILMTGTADTLRFCSGSTERGLDLAPHIHVLDVVEHNLPDIELFVKTELENCKALQGDQEEILWVVAKMREDLPRNARGNFKDAQQIVEQVRDAIESELTKEDILMIIGGKTLKDVQKLIDELNGSLKAHEIDQLNELLIWVIYAYEWLDEKKMEAALFMRTNRKPFVPLRKKVEEKYHSILQIDSDDDGNVKTKNYDFVEFFQKSIRERKVDIEDAENDPKISMTIQIDRVNQSQVQRFFWDLSGKVLLDKFQFTASTSGPEQTAKITANMTEAHLTIVKRCFDLLLNEPIPETAILGRYALRYLPWHLEDLRLEDNKESLQPAEKEDIVDSLVGLLQSVDTIEKHLVEDFLQFEGWLDGRFEVEVVEGWLHDSEATSRLRRKERTWLKQVDSEGWPFALKEIARMIARQWLCFSRFPAPSPFQWIDTWLDRMDQKQVQDAASAPENGGSSEMKSDQDQTKDEVGDKHVMPAKARIARAAAWAEKEAETTKNSLYYERLGHTYLDQDESECAIEAFVKAKAFPNTSLQVSRGLAEAYAVANKKDMAVKEMEVVIASLRSKEPAIDQANDLASSLSHSAMWHKDLGHTLEAIDYLREAIRLDPLSYQRYHQLLKTLLDSNAESEALTVLNEMNIAPAKELGLTKLQAMFLTMAEREPVESFESIFHFTRHRSLFNMILQALERTIASTHESATNSTVIQLRLIYGVALAGYSTQEQKVESALHQWRKGYELGLQSRVGEDWFWARKAASRIFNIHYSKAKSLQSSAEEMESNLTELKNLTEKMQMCSPRDGEVLQRVLATFYRSIGKQEAARQLLLNQMKSGIDLLSDDDPENDWVGFATIAEVLMHTGDDLNASSARFLSFAGQRASYSPGLTCDGRCNKPVSWMDSLWFCKICEDVQLHDECLTKLREGTLTHYVCGPDHDWLYVPSTVEEEKAIGEGNVRMGGELQDGKRLGGKIVAIKDWLDTIRENWGIEKYRANVQIEESKS